MRPTEILKQDHKVINVVLDVLERIVSDIQAGEDFNVEDLEKITDFIRTFADKCHHGKEEDLLFPAMEKAGIPREGGPISVMLQEHDIGRNYVRGLAQAISDYKTGDRGSSNDIVDNAMDYVNLLREHIYKEDNILYMMADAHLDKSTEEDLIREFEKVEARMGEGVHERYHQLVEDLKEKYLGGKNG